MAITTITVPNVEDTDIKSAGGDTNYGSQTYMETRTTLNRVLIRFKNIAANVGVNQLITDAKIRLYCSWLSAADTIYCHRIFKNWDLDTELTWNDWDAPASEWGTSGCNSADDGGVDNSSDGSGADRRATAESSDLVDTIGQWYEWDVTSLCQKWYDGSANENGCCFLGLGGASQIQRFRTSEYVGTGQPELVITHDDAPVSSESIKDHLISKEL